MTKGVSASKSSLGHDYNFESPRTGHHFLLTAPGAPCLIRVRQRAFENNGSGLVLSLALVTRSIRHVSMR